MSDKEQVYAVGDWIVHLTYGVGQIQKKEKKTIGGIKRMCFRVKTDDGVFWLPIDNANNERIRPIASPTSIQRALRILKRAPKKMDANYKTRRKRIQKVCLDGDLRTDMRLVRDLHARQFKKGLNETEVHALTFTTNRFLKEWSLCKGLEINEARRKFEHFLKISREKEIQNQDSQTA